MVPHAIRAGTRPRTGSAGSRTPAKVAVALRPAEDRERGKKGLIRSKGLRTVIERSSNSHRHITIAIRWLRACGTRVLTKCGSPGKSMARGSVLAGTVSSVFVPVEFLGASLRLTTVKDYVAVLSWVARRARCAARLLVQRRLEPDLD